MPPSDPDERLASLHEAMDGAIALLEAGGIEEYDQLMREYMDPFWAARIAAGANIDMDALYQRLSVFDPDDFAFHVETMLSSIKKHREEEPTWLLDGRVAHFMELAGDSHRAEFWIWLDGRWMISPET